MTQTQIPRFYKPWPHQQLAWERRLSGKYDYYFKLNSRQTGKDADDIQYLLYRVYQKPGRQAAYLGLDNVWVKANIFNKTYVAEDNVERYFWADYPKTIIEAKPTQREVIFNNNEEDTAQGRVRFFGMKNEAAAIGSSYNDWVISEAGLYRPNTFDFLFPIWENKRARGLDYAVCINGTPRGMRNVYYELLKRFTGCDDPNDFPGEHKTVFGSCYVDKVTADQVYVPVNGGYRRLFSDEKLEQMRQECIRMYGNDSWFRQEYFCDFLAVNAGIVYQGIEILQKEHRFTQVNPDPKYPVILAFDVASAKKTEKKSDSTACVVFQYVAGQLRIIDWYEESHVSLVEAIGSLQSREWFKLVRNIILPWDTENYQTMKGPRQEAEEAYPNIEFYTLGQTRNVMNDIQIARSFIPNLWINSQSCDYLMKAFEEYEYKRFDKLQEWSSKPIHNWASHLMDAFRYACVALTEMEFQKIDIGFNKPAMPATYSNMFDEEPKKTKSPIWMTEKERRDNAREQRSMDGSFGF